MKSFVGSLLILALFPLQALAFDRQVTRTDDEPWGEGTLRTILFKSCDEDGDDDIGFEGIKFYDVAINLQTPLVIPQDCHGKIRLRGREEGSTRLALLTASGGEEAGDSCILHVYSDANRVESLIFSSNTLGAGLCLFGRKNEAVKNHFEGDRYGIVASDAFAAKYPGMDGSESRLEGNIVAAGSKNGLFVQAHKAQILDNTVKEAAEEGLLLIGDQAHVSGNKITDGKSDGIQLLGANAVLTKNEILSNAGYGVSVMAGSHDVTIGGPAFESDHNVIRQNQKGGVVVYGDKNTSVVTITHNTISQNGDQVSDVDLQGDGVTLNDTDDLDEGPNQYLNFMDYLQAFPLVPSPEGKPRYWGWGIAKSGTRTELYLTEENDPERKHGGGEAFLGDAAIAQNTFSSPAPFVMEGDSAWLGVLSFDAIGNTSEFAANTAFGPDADLDGIIDEREEGNARDLVDSDGDGLPDSVEDANRNGKWEQELGETSAQSADSDEDGVSDAAETHGDGRYDAGIDSNPLVADTDQDGLTDGQEDKNGNGVVELYLGESSPLLADSDRDNVVDGKDNCPGLYNPGQEAFFCAVATP